MFGVYVGTRLGLYEQLSTHGRVTAPELAGFAGIHPRYAREWLEQQAVAGFLTVDDVTHHPDERRYELPADHLGALANPDDPAHAAPFADMLIGVARALDDVVEAYRSGGGVPYPRYGAAFRRGQAGANRPSFNADLTAAWLPAMPDVHARLRRSGARIADVGCGQGWSTVALARAYPAAEVVGLDSDEASIAEARRLAADTGSRARFLRSDGAALEGRFDAVLMLECLHDMARPVEALAAARAALTHGGSVLVVDENVADSFTVPGDLIERMMYGWSISHCLPASMAEPNSAGLGTVLRPDTVRALAAAAGFGVTEVVDVDAGFFRVYRLRDR
jgi:2-polyprenyl-3-methyl-5-hydroxy-6-metoxy-1,4-benzoquinol methylase